MANVDEEANTIDRMRKEIERLKKLIADKKAMNASGDNDEEISELKEVLNHEMN